MSDDLVKWLRTSLSMLAQEEAADRIEELDKAWKEWADAAHGNYQRAKAAEAKLVKAVEALERIEDASRHFGNDPEASETTVRYAHETTRRLCSTTLAELKGDPDAT